MENKDMSENDKLMDHEYDGIRELDNHMPRWWVWGFYFTIAFAAFYMIYYTVASGPSSLQEYEAEIAASPRKQIAVPVQETGFKPLTDKASLEAGEQLFVSQTCAACHSPNLGGLVGPNLTDDFWIHGCDVSRVMGNIKSGFPQKGMMPYGNGKPLPDSDLHKIASFILSKRGTNPAGAKAIDSEREKPCTAK